MRRGSESILVSGAMLALMALAALAGEENSMLERIPTGEFWYRMLDEQDEPQGYAHMVVGREGEDRLTVAWELRIASSDGNYEESRRMAVDATGRLVESAYHAFGNLVCAGTWKDGTWLVSTLVEGSVVQKEADPLPPDAISGMGFVLAAVVPREAGGALERPEVDEANGFDPLGMARFVWEGREARTWEGEPLHVHRILVKKASGKDLPLQIADDGRIIEADWGGGNRMVLAKASTLDLYRPAPPALAVISEGEQLLLRGELEAFEPEEVYDHFTKPDLLRTFWAPEAEVEPKPGGRYRLHWPGPGWRLAGEVEEAERGRRLSFTWRWEHAPEAPVLRVRMDLEPRDGGGCVVTLRHGPYRDTAGDAKERQGHLQGWLHVFGRLRASR